jgi:aminoacyl tRNA synthase complex-interacting multifunctional protein 1
MSHESKKSAIDLINEVITDLEAKLGLYGEGKSSTTTTTTTSTTSCSKPELHEPSQQITTEDVTQDHKSITSDDMGDVLLPNICKLEIKVGKVVKVWVHPESDKLYCEEIDVGEEVPRPIVSGLRAHYKDEGQLLGKKVLVVTNLKPRKLAGFLSNGMVLCAVSSPSGMVEILEPPEDAPVGEVVHFQALPMPSPYTPSQVDKKQIFQNCMVDMKTTIDDGIAAWKGHAFLTSAGPCKSYSIRGGEIR